MHGRLKHAAELASSTGASAASPIPSPSIAPTFAPGKKGPAGLAPRTNYSRVNTGEPPALDAGAAAQKSMPPRGAEMLPKLAGGERSMGQIAGRRTLQDLVKSAMVESAERVRINEEARTQAQNLGEKVASATAPVAESRELVGQDVEKLASALDFLAGELETKEGSFGGPYNLHASAAASDLPPGVSAAKASTPLPDKKGEGVHTIPMRPGTQPGTGSLMENNLNHRPGGKEKMVLKNAGADVVSLVRAKLASDEAEKKETEGLNQAEKGVEKAKDAHESEPENKKASALADYLLSRTKAAGEKVAEDAINPARITAGRAVPPEASASGQPGGQPAGGAPQGPTGLIESNTSAANYTKGQSHGPRREELKKYFNEPALSAQHDHVLQDAFAHTGEAGPKIAAANAPTPPAPAAPAASAAPAPAHPAPTSVKTAAARALLINLAKTAEAEANKKTPNDAAASA